MPPPLQPRRAATLLIVRLPPRLDPFEAAVRRTDSLDQTTPLRVTHLGFPRSGALWIEPIEECANLGVRLLHRLGQLLWEATDRPCHRHVISALELLGRPLIHKAQTSRVELCCDAVAQLSQIGQLIIDSAHRQTRHLRERWHRQPRQTSRARAKFEKGEAHADSRAVLDDPVARQLELEA